MYALWLTHTCRRYLNLFLQTPLFIISHSHLGNFQPLLSWMQQTSRKPWAYLVPLHFNLPTGHIFKTTFTVGRKVTCDLVLHQPFVSHHHLTIYRRMQGRSYEYTLVCHSKNGLYINKTKITDSKNKLVKNNDEIWLVNRSAISKCRQICFRFISDEFSQQQVMLHKYEKELLALEQFAGEVKRTLKCSKCEGVMPMPISLQPCSHKVCENCALHMIQNLIDRCCECNRMVVTFFEDQTFNRIISAYNKYKFGEEMIVKSNNFAENPFIMQKWMEHNNKDQRKQNEEKELEICPPTIDLQQTPQPKPVKMKSLLRNNLQMPSASFYDVSARKIQEKLQPQKDQLTSQEFQCLMNEINHIGKPSVQASLQEAQLIKKSSEVESQRLETSSIQTSSAQNPKTIRTADCWHCKKKFPFTLKKIEQKQCLICMHPFCNRQFPPCKSGEDPLRSLNERLRILSTTHILSFFDQKLKKAITKKLLSSIAQQSQLAFLFKYVLMRCNGCFDYAYAINENEVRKVQIKLASCVCIQCWPALARRMLLTFLKHHQEKLKNFSRKDMEQVVFEVKKQAK